MVRWNSKVSYLALGGVIVAFIVLLKLIYLDLPIVYLSAFGLTTNAPEIYITPLFLFIFCLNFKQNFRYSFFLFVSVAFVSSLIVWVIVPLTFYVGSIFFDYVFVFLLVLFFIPFVEIFKRTKRRIFIIIGVLVVHFFIFLSHFFSSILFFSSLQLKSVGIVAWATIYNVGYVFVGCLIVIFVMNLFLVLGVEKKSFCTF